MNDLFKIPMNINKINLPPGQERTSTHSVTVTKIVRKIQK